MTSTTVLVLTWLVFAHLVADFVLQNDWIAMNKATGGREGWGRCGVHGFHVAICLLPRCSRSGLPRLRLPRRGRPDPHGSSTAGRSRRPAGPSGPRRRRPSRGMRAARTTTPSGLGAAWTPWPGMLFLADQGLHLTIAIVGWLVILQGIALSSQFVDAVNRVLGVWDRATVHAVVLTGVVIVSLFLVNTRAAYYFVLALVSPRDIPETEKPPKPKPAATPPDPGTGLTRAALAAAVPLAPVAAVLATNGEPATGAARRRSRTRHRVPRRPLPLSSRPPPTRPATSPRRPSRAGPRPASAPRSAPSSACSSSRSSSSTPSRPSAS